MLATTGVDGRSQDPGQPGEAVLRSLAERPELRPRLRALDAAAFPPFMEYSDLAALWPAIYGLFPEWQLALCDARTGEHFAHGNAVPFAWAGTDADLPRSAVELVSRAIEGRRAGWPATALGALQVVVDPARQGRGHSARVLRGVAGLAADRGLADLLAPIRPNRKDRAPLVSLAAYVQRTGADGLPLDPWQRVHARLGARPVGIAGGWLTVVAPLRAWETWAGAPFPATGGYPVPGALVPVAIDVERGCGRYVEPHLWMRYRLARAGDAPSPATPGR